MPGKDTRVESILEQAWTHCAPRRSPSKFPNGFWPDVARIAVELALGLPPEQDWRATRCLSGNSPEPPRSRPKSSAKKSAATKAANTAALLALLDNPTPDIP